MNTYVIEWYWKHAPHIFADEIRSESDDVVEVISEFLDNYGHRSYFDEQGQRLIVITSIKPIS